LARSFETISESLRAKINARNRKIKTHRGSLVSDVVIEGPSEELAKLHDQIENVSKNQSLETADSDGLKSLGFNKNKRIKAGIPSIVEVTFFANSLPVTDVTIPAGTVVTTKTGLSLNEIRFKTLRTLKMYASVANTYLNSTTGKFEISTEVEALNNGSQGNVGAYTINTIVGSITGIDGCYNSLSAAGGTDIESNESYRQRIALAERGNNIGTKDGLLSIILENEHVEDAIIIGNRESTRREIGAVDIYIKGLKIQQFIDTFLIRDQDKEFLFTKRPITYGSVEAIAFSDDSISIPPHIIQKDSTSQYQGSVIAVDKIIWDDVLNPALGSVYLTYSYNSLVEELQNLFLDSDKEVQNIDILVHWAREIDIDITCAIRVLPGFSEASTKTEIRNNLATFFSSVKIGEEIQQADVAGIIINTAGVDDVTLPFSIFKSTDDTVLQDEIGNLQIPNNSYAAAGTIIINTII
jgi:uncharacterized phage protein gp47/JayE